MWFSDQVQAQTPAATLVTVPMWVYKFAMLAWALWLVVAVIRWVRWGYGELTHDGFFQGDWKAMLGLKPKTTDEAQEVGPDALLDGPDEAPTPE